MSRIKEFNLPDLGEGLTEGEILAWLVKVGDTIELNQPIVEVETAKAAVEIPAKWAGVVTRIFHEAGVTVEVGAPIISIDTQPGAAEEPAAEEPAAEAKAPTGRTPVLVGYGPKDESNTRRRPRSGTATHPTTAPSPTPPAAATASPVPAPAPAPVTPAPVTPARTGPVLAKPPVRKLARDLGVDLATVPGSGPQGSVTRDDVHEAAAHAAKPEAAADAGAAPTPAALFGPDREQRIPIKGVRKLTAENMVRSAFTAPHVTEFLTVDVTRSMKALEKLKARPEFAELRVSPLLLVAKAVLLAVKRHPMVNSSWSGETGEIVIKEYVNLGIAAATDRGLIVPNVKDAGRLTLRELAESLNALTRTARSGRTSPADMAGGTLSITNVGVFGIDTGTPILPPGESAILAFGAIRPTPWVHKGKIKIRQVTTLGLSFDHRIIDGELGSKFLRDIGAFLTDPSTTLLSWS
ncbi:dihydrolipoamide acetyltransferase family protein [Actinoplanes sp. NPDC051851]|uniref:dihydrolipoamide acetyltransferase family protein n=1 Tax=Actinoplanes sp. NPDC051851 TaxID=3154753 RepID=UPI003416B458